MPGLDERFRALHRARTAGDKVRRLFPNSRRRDTGRPDKYVDPYAGREYEDRPEPLRAREVMTVAYQQLLADPADDIPGKDMSPYRQLLSDDPEMAALAIGLLMRYDPDP